MVVYTQENEVKFVQSVASASTLISSLTGEIKEYIIGKFPSNFFKSVYIDTAETVSEQNRNDRNSNTLNKKPYPQLAISPEISMDDPVADSSKAMHLSSPNLYLRNDMRGTYKKIIVDPDQKYSMYFTSDYITTNFNFKIVVNKYIQNIDLAYYIKSNFQMGFFQYLNGKYLNTEIPKTYIRVIAALLDLDLTNDTDMNTLEKYLISTGKQKDYIKRKVNLATGKDCFFVNELNNFLVLVSDLDVPASSIRESMSEGEYTISFRVQVSAWLPNAFIFSANLEKLGSVDGTEIIENIDNDEQTDGFYSLSIAPANPFLLNRKEATWFTGADGATQFIGQEIFRQVYTYPLSLTAINISLSALLKEDFNKVHAYMVAHNLDTRDLLSVELYNRYGKIDLQILDNDLSTELPAGNISYETLQLNLLLTEGTDFSLTIYGNRAIYETILEAIAIDKFFFKENALSILYTNINEEIIPVPVYAFLNESAMLLYSYKTSLRVNTIYGPGYIGLVPIDDVNASDYRILVDIVDGEEIIYAIEKTEFMI